MSPDGVTAGDGPSPDWQGSVRPTAESLFLNARERAGDEARARYLVEACGGDEELRRRVESMLRSAARADAYFGRRDGALDPVAHGLAEGPGARIGRYELQRVIGQGGMGTVYLARQKEPVRREVALKIIRPGMDTRQVVARFEAERQALAWMDHPNIARMLDAGATETGRPYFVMEWVQGMRITEHCEHRRLPLAARLRLFVQVCLTVQHAHQKGVVHRDLKPSNILVVEHDGRASPKVIDFGVAKAMGGSGPSGEEPPWGGSGPGLVGTPAYMSPEQVDRVERDIDTRSDIYSLGVLLYELLTGCTPFDTDRLLGLGLSEWTRALRETEPPRPSERISRLPSADRARVAEARGVAVRRGVEWLRGDLDCIVMKCLEKDRSRRYATANGLASDVERYLSDQPVTARPSSMTDRLGKAYRRNRAVFVAALAAMVVLLLATVVSGWMAVRASRQAERSERLLYFAKMQLAQRAWDENDLGRLRRLLVETSNHRERSFEWYHWMQLAHAASHAFRGSGSIVPRLAVSGAGDRLASAEVAGKVRVWDVGRRRLCFDLTLTNAEAWSVALSPDGRCLVAGDNQGMIHWWEARTGKVLGVVDAHTNRVMDLRFEPTRGLLLSSGQDGTVLAWKEGAATPTRVVARHGAAIWSFAIDAAHGRLFTGSWDGTVGVWSLEEGSRERGILSGVRLAALPYGLAISPDGERLAIGDQSGRVTLLDVESGRVTREFQAHADVVPTVAFSADGHWLATGGGDRLVKLWDARSGELRHTLRGHERLVECVAFLPESRRLLSSADDGFMRLWDLGEGVPEPGSPPFVFSGTADWLQSLALSPDGDRVAGTVNGAWVWDTVTGRRLLDLVGHTGMVTAVAYSPDGKQLATAGEDRQVHLWSAGDGIERRRFGWPYGVPRFLGFFSDNRRLLVAGAAGVGVFDSADGRELVRFSSSRGELRQAALSREGGWVATAGEDRVVVVSEAVGGRERARWGPLEADIGALEFSPDGGRLAVASGASVIQVYEVPSGRRLMETRDNVQGTHALRFTPDGRRLLVVSESSSGEIIDAATGYGVLSLRGGQGVHRAGAISADGRVVVLGTLGNAAPHLFRVWRAASPERCASWLEAEAGRGPAGQE